jgi:hypothetical protein
MPLAPKGRTPHRVPAVYFIKYDTESQNHYIIFSGAKIAWKEAVGRKLTVF